MFGLKLIITAIVYIMMLMQYAILARAILSFFPISQENMLIRVLNGITEPILGPIRNLMEKTGLLKNTMLDFSPLIAFLIIGIIIKIIL